VLRLEAACDGTRPQRCPGTHWPYDTFEIPCSQVLKLEQVAHELARALCNDHAVRLRDALQARGKIRRFADNGLLLRGALPDEVANDHHPRGDAYARLEGRVGLQITCSRYQLQT
jgi:hypothetical protein